MKKTILPLKISAPNWRASAPLDELAALPITFVIVAVLVFGAVVLEAPGLDEDVLVEPSNALVVGGYSDKH